ncbi:hypothetical protein NC652_012320 [Populus alba x Populus x berolinensis]|nr:hypothetical protein NC652_012320 [Populus alba x Populus x berolinensis]
MSLYIQKTPPNSLLCRGKCVPFGVDCSNPNRTCKCYGEKKKSLNRRKHGVSEKMGPEGCVHAPKGWSCETLKWECVGYKVDCNETGCPAYIYWMDLFPADIDSDNQQHIHKVNQSRGGETRAAVELSSQGQRYDFSTDVFSPVFSSRLEPVENIEYCCSRRRSQQRRLLVACRFEKVQKKDVSCSICLVELEKEDMVSQLSRCMHVFHTDCIDKWIQRDHFTCPLCRTSIDY